MTPKSPAPSPSIQTLIGTVVPFYQGMNCTLNDPCVVHYYSEDGFSIQFRFSDDTKERSALNQLSEKLEECKIRWLNRNINTWTFNVPMLKDWISSSGHDWKPKDAESFLGKIEWLDGIHEFRFVYEKVESSYAYCQLTFTIYKKDYQLTQNQKIFLSHKGTDKSLVRLVNKVLKTLGFAP